MQLLIMAGGEGQRLRPLTQEMPKPMVTVANQPLLEHICRLARRHGYRATTLTVHYQFEAIRRYFGRGERWQLELDLAVEHEPLGTAGGVRAAWRPGESVLVLSGDALTDLDLSELVAFHRARRAKATMALYEVNDPTGFGVVQTAPDGRVLRFVEKPPRGTIAGGFVNTGIYVLEPEVLRLIPVGSPCDFGRDLFPHLVQIGVPVYGWAASSGYWCDAGTLGSYLDANLAALRRDVLLELGGREVAPGIRLGANVHLHPQAQLQAPVLIGNGARIGPGVLLHQAIIGAGASVGEGAEVERSVVLAGQSVAAGAELRRAIVSPYGLLQPQREALPTLAAQAAQAPA